MNWSSERARLYNQRMAIALTESLNNIVWIDPNGQNGEPCFYGTRVAVKVLFDYLKGGHTVEDFLEGFPPVTREQAEIVLDASQGSLYETLRAETRQKELAHLNGLLLDGINSGEATPMTADDWQEIRTEVRRRAEKRAGNKKP
jgi:uncharacterized protein (DUF433 family)